MGWSAIAILKQTPKPGARSDIRRWRCTRFSMIKKEGPISKHRLRELLGGEISEAALDRALDELWAKLRITRVDYKPDEGVFWDVLFRWSPDAVKEGMHVSLAESLTALVSKYLDCVLAAPQEELEQFFSHFVGRARVREAINALQAARELSFVHVGGRVLLQVVFAAGAPPEPQLQPEPTEAGIRSDLRRGRKPLVAFAATRRAGPPADENSCPNYTRGYRQRMNRAQAGDRH